jgi:uncharacterized protein YndB with AHSA1/START domain
MTKIIRKEIVIDAPPEKVWEHITDPAKIAGWLMPNTFAAKVGQDYTMDCGTAGPITGVVTEIIPLKKLVYTWNSPIIKSTTTVTITLTEEKKGRTRLVLEHSGWQIPPTDPEVAGRFDQGWGEHLQALQDQIAGKPMRQTHG